MGWRSTIVVMHDLLHEIAAEPGFGKRLETLCLAHPNEKVYRDYNLTRGVTVIEKNHADANCVMLVHDYGGDYLCSTGTQTEEAALRALADKLGFRLVRKAKSHA
jgi:hypothetical protein